MKTVLAFLALIVVGCSDASVTASEDCDSPQFQCAGFECTRIAQSGGTNYCVESRACPSLVCHAGDTCTTRTHWRQ